MYLKANGTSDHFQFQCLHSEFLRTKCLILTPILFESKLRNVIFLSLYSISAGIKFLQQIAFIRSIKRSAEASIYKYKRFVNNL